MEEIIEQTINKVQWIYSLIKKTKDTQSNTLDNSIILIQTTEYNNFVIE